MATSREYLQSIIGVCAELQNMDDRHLGLITEELKEVDNILDNAVDALEDVR